MIIGVLSDTHGNHALMYKAAQMLAGPLEAVHLIHLGDDWEDKELLEFQGYAVSGVPGLWCDAYNDSRVSRARVDTFDGLTIGYAHDPQVLPPATSNIDLFLAGHTHQCCIDFRRGIPFMNPGHLKNARDRRREATCGLIDVRKDTFSLHIVGLDGKTRQSRVFPRDAFAKEATHGS